MFAALVFAVALVGVNTLAALVAVGVTFLNEVIKQTWWPRWANAIVAGAVQVVAAAIVTVQQAGASSVTWHDFAAALLAATIAFLGTYHAIIKPIVGDRLKTASSLRRPAVAAWSPGTSRAIDLGAPAAPGPAVAAGRSQPPG